MRIASAVFCFALAGFVCLHPAPAAAAEGTVRAVPLHRLFHYGSHASCYVTRDEEIHTLLTKGWKEAGIEGYISQWPFAGGVFFHRLWHPLNGDYYYTADPKSVSDYIQNRGYLAQKGVGYVLPPGSNRAGTVPLHMGYDEYNKRHIYVADKITWVPNFTYVMEACRVWSDAAVVSEIRVTSPKAGQVLSVGGRVSVPTRLRWAPGPPRRGPRARPRPWFPAPGHGGPRDPAARGRVTPPRSPLPSTGRPLDPPPRAGSPLRTGPRGGAASCAPATLA